MSATHNFSAADIMAANIQGIQRGLALAMGELQTNMRIRLSQKGGGVGYIGGRKGKGSFRTRSSPGQPPAVDTGTLRNSVQIQPRKVNGTGFISIVMAGLVAGVHKDARIPGWLERGTSRMKARPFIAPSLKEIRPTVADTISKQMELAIKRMQTRAMRST